MTDQVQHGSSPAPGGVQPHKRGHGWLIAFLALVIVVLLVIAGVLPRVRARDKVKQETQMLAVPSVNVMQPKRGAPQQEIVLPGNMQAFTDAPIYARTNGYLKSWNVDIGTHVKAGQLLAIIETPEVDQQLQQARADLNTAQANYNLSQITAQRFDGLANTDAVSKQDVDNAHGDFEAKKAMVASAQSNLKRLEETQGFNKIYAPFDGVITARNTDVGQLVDSGSGAPAKELFHIAAINTLRVYINVPQQYSVAAKPGLTADLTLAQFPGRTFQGKLVRTANAIDMATRTLLVEVDVTNSTGELLPGAYVQVHLKLPNAVPAFIVPVSALIFRSEGLQVGVVDQNNKAALVTITPGRDFGSEIEVVSGLDADSKVIVNPPDSLIQGEEVRIVPPPQQNGQSQQQGASPAAPAGDKNSQPGSSK